MPRDYRRFNGYLNNLSQDIYPQPPDPGHTEQAQAYLDWALGIVGGTSVLDIGCGEGFCRTMFEERGIEWQGVTMGPDYEECLKLSLPVERMDMSFLQLPDNSFDLLFARHVLEHSPFPILTLMEWRRVCRNYLLIVLPTPDYWGFGGKNHYSVFNQEQWFHSYSKAGWKIIHESKLTTRDKAYMDHYMPEITNRTELVFPGPPKDVEYWYILEKGEEKKE